MKKRLGDRRSRPRFDVIGSLIGLVEAWRPFEVRNVGLGGALVESSVPLSPRTRLSGRLSVNDRPCQVRVHVCHLRPLLAGREGRYLAGVQWIDSTVPIVEVLSMESADADGDRVEGDRRQSRRTADPERCEVSLCVSAPAAVVDISASGVLFSSKVLLEPGSNAHVTLRLGQEDFAGDIDIRRIEDPPGGAEGHAGDWRIGAAFTSMNDASRKSLDLLLAPTS